MKTLADRQSVILSPSPCSRFCICSHPRLYAHYFLDLIVRTRGIRTKKKKVKSGEKKSAREKKIHTQKINGGSSTKADGRTRVIMIYYVSECNTHVYYYCKCIRFVHNSCVYRKEDYHRRRLYKL